MTTRQVTGNDKELRQAIQDGDFPKPPLMSWNPWQKWRRDVGGRPSSSVDGGTTTNPTESALWKSVMLEHYGPEWAVMAASADVTEEEPPEVLMTAGTAPASVTSLEPSAAASNPVTAATAVGGMSTPRRAQEISPGSGQAGGTASPGSGIRSPASWTSRSPGTPTALRQRIFKDYSPATELLETYVARIQRQAAALSSLGEPLEDGHLEIVLAKANYELRLFEDAPGYEARQTRILTREFVFELLEITGTEAQAGRLFTLEAMLAARGADVEDIKTKAASGQPVAITPEAVQAAPPPQVLGPKRGSAPSHEPAAPAGFQKFNIFGQGADTPTGRPPVDPELEKIRHQLRERTSQLENKDSWVARGRKTTNFITASDGMTSSVAERYAA